MSVLRVTDHCSCPVYIIKPRTLCLTSTLDTSPLRLPPQTDPFTAGHLSAAQLRCFMPSFLSCALRRAVARWLLLTLMSSCSFMRTCFHNVTVKGHSLVFSGKKKKDSQCQAGEQKTGTEKNPSGNQANVQCHSEGSCNFSGSEPIYFLRSEYGSKVCSVWKPRQWKKWLSPTKPKSCDIF